MGNDRRLGAVVPGAYLAAPRRRETADRFDHDACCKCAGDAADRVKIRRDLDHVEPAIPVLRRQPHTVYDFA